MWDVKAFASGMVASCDSQGMPSRMYLRPGLPTCQDLPKDWHDGLVVVREAAFSDDVSLVAMAGRGGKVEVRDVLTSQLAH